MTQRDIKLKIIEQAEVMAKEIAKGKDLEIKSSNCGLKILSVDKKKVG